MLPRVGTVVAFCGRILALGRWNLQMSWCKCPGVLRGQHPGWSLISALSQRILNDYKFILKPTTANLAYP